MTRVLQRTNFHSSKLLRCLAELDIVDAAVSEHAFGEKLGLWVHFADAITLSAVHNDSGATLPKIHPADRRGAQAAIGVEFDRVRTIMTNTVVASCSSSPTATLTSTHIVLQPPALALPIDLTATYLPYRRFYEAHQREMEVRVQPLRVTVRNALSTASSRLRQLADLDATLENILRDRERKLLAKVPLLLKKRFEHLHQEHHQLCVATQRADNPADWLQAGGWLTHFCSELQMLLLAEVALRLQPTLGLIEAFTGHNE